MQPFAESTPVAPSSTAAEPATGDSTSGRFSVLQSFDRAMRVEEPFPHVISDECLPEESYRALSDSFPLDLIPESVRAISNKRYDIFASWGTSPNNPALAPAPWRAFMQQNETAGTAWAVCALFRPYLGSQVSSLFQPLSGHAAIAPADIRVRVSIGVNTPARQPTRVRGPHCDRLTKAFVGLFYLRDPAEGDRGGDLLLYRWKSGRRRDRTWPSAIEEEEVDVVATIAYAPNRLVVFMNSDDSIHGVSPRLPGEHFRRLVVISGWFPGYRDDQDTVRALGLSAAG